MGKIERLPRSKEHAFQPPLLDLRTGFPLRSTVPSCTYLLTVFPFSIEKKIFQRSNYMCLALPLRSLCLPIYKFRTKLTFSKL